MTWCCTYQLSQAWNGKFCCQGTCILITATEFRALRIHLRKELFSTKPPFGTEAAEKTNSTRCAAGGAPWGPKILDKSISRMFGKMQSVFPRRWMGPIWDGWNEFFVWGLTSLEVFYDFSLHPKYCVPQTWKRTKSVTVFPCKSEEEGEEGGL